VLTALPSALQAQTSVDSFFDLLAGRTNYTINGLALPLQARHKHLIKSESQQASFRSMIVWVRVRGVLSLARPTMRGPTMRGQALLMVAGGLCALLAP